MKLRIFPRQRDPEPTTEDELEAEERLVDAEKRANVLLEKAEWLHATVARRDDKNHWQASVNRLFLGGNT